MQSSAGTVPVGPGDARKALLPAAGLPLLYFGFAHLCLALALAVLLVRPDLPGGFFHHPRMIAVVHLVTLGWITSSILGAFYIVGPLALRLPLRPGWRDRAAFMLFAAGVTGDTARLVTDHESARVQKTYVHAEIAAVDAALKLARKFKGR